MSRANINDAKCVLIVGATAGIGRALALAIHDLPSKPTVIVSGRRRERLDELCKTSERIKAAPVDLTAGRDALKLYVEELVSAYPNLDAIILSSGIQHIFNFQKPGEVDLDLFEQELETNYISMVTLIKFFMPHLLDLNSKGLPSFIVPITSGLAICPLPAVLGYSATKAALHSLVLSLDHQLRNTKVQVMEIIPPLTESELHDHQGTTPLLSKYWMPLEQFTKDAMAGLCRGDVLIGVGDSQDKLDKWESGKLEAISRTMPTPD